jgi:aspartyl-tRNA(Asn)/glutamyl-tRNA(Gln) amidotransferase subunit B
MKDYKVTIGLEIHVALKTDKKLFSQTLNGFDCDEFSLFDIGMPGVMPMTEKEPVEMAVAFGLAVGADIQKYSEFERKHYFYPDLPLGYQITQQHQPILIGGSVDLGEGKTVLIEHAHLECDAAKSVHDGRREYTEIDISRAASPLLEIVSLPCIHSPLDAKLYAKKVYELVTFLDICDGKMEEGSFRVDASISLSKTETLGKRVEIKNISSFSFLERALDFEISRQAEILDAHGEVRLETRLFDEVSMETLSMRDKESVADYRYMPDPDIQPLVIDEAFISLTRKQYKVDYFQRIEKLKGLFADTVKDFDFAGFLKEQGVLCESILSTGAPPSEYFSKILLYWYPEVSKKLKNQREVTLEDLKVLESAKLEAKEAKAVLERWLSSKLKISECLPIFMPTSDLIDLISGEALKWPDQMEKARKGDIKVAQFLVGKMMAAVQGRAVATEVKRVLEDLIKG